MTEKRQVPEPAGDAGSGHGELRDSIEEAIRTLYHVVDLAEEINDVEMAELALLSIVKLRLMVGEPIE